MPITPTTLIATSGLVNGQGFQISPNMISALTTANSNPLVSNISLVAATGTPDLDTVLATLPPFITNTTVLAGNITAQAEAILPPGSGTSGIKSFLSIHSSASGGAGMMAEISAALTEFSSKGFGDMGINSGSFHDVLTQGVTSMTPSLGSVASLATQLPLGSLGSFSGAANPLGSASSLISGSGGLGSIVSGAGSLATKLGSLIPSPGAVAPLGSLPSVSGLGSLATSVTGSLTSAIGSALPSITAGLGSKMGGLTSALGTQGVGSNLTAEASGASQLTSDSLNASLASVGNGLQSFGTLYDFTNMPLGPMNLLHSLQAQGLADSVGINNDIIALDYDPNGTVPDSVLTNIFSNVTGSDLQKIIDQTGTQIVNPVVSLADLLNVENIMPPDAVTALGVTPGSEGLASLSNAFTNLGIQVNNFQAGAYIASMSTIPTPNLDQLTTLIPDSVVANLTPNLGTGNGPSGNPTMLDMLGTIGGVVHTDSFTTINSALTNITNSSAGQNLLTAAVEFLNGGSLEDFTTAVNSFNSAISSDSSLSSLADQANTAFSASQTQLTKEQQNLSLVGVSLFTSSGAPATQPASGGVTSIFNLGNKLHDFGVDKQNLGHNELFNAIATNDLTGDAIRASLLEGRNLTKSYAVGKSTPSVAS